MQLLFPDFNPKASGQNPTKPYPNGNQNIKPFFPLFLQFITMKTHVQVKSCWSWSLVWDVDGSGRFWTVVLLLGSSNKVSPLDNCSEILLTGLRRVTSHALLTYSRRRSRHLVLILSKWFKLVLFWGVAERTWESRVRLICLCLNKRRIPPFWPSSNQMCQMHKAICPQ